MVSKHTLNQYDFSYMEQYFEYILDSILNGQHKQAKELYKELSEKQKSDFLDFRNTYGIETQIKSLIN